MGNPNLCFQPTLNFVMKFKLLIGGARWTTSKVLWMKTTFSTTSTDLPRSILDINEDREKNKSIEQTICCSIQGPSHIFQNIRMTLPINLQSNLFSWEIQIFRQIHNGSFKSITFWMQNEPFWLFKVRGGQLQNRSTYGSFLRKTMIWGILNFRRDPKLFPRRLHSGSKQVAFL